MSEFEYHTVAEQLYDLIYYEGATAVLIADHLRTAISEAFVPKSVFDRHELAWFLGETRMREAKARLAELEAQLTEAPLSNDVNQPR